MFFKKPKIIQNSDWKMAAKQFETRIVVKTDPWESIPKSVVYPFLYNG